MTRKVLRERCLSAVVLGLLALAAAAPPMHAEEAGAWTLESALKQLDQSSKDFRTAVADVELIVIDGAGAEPRTASGKAYFSRDGSSRFDLTAPDVKSLLCTGSDLYVYEPAKAIVERFPVNKYAERLEPYPSLGFSLTGKALSRDYLVGLLGEATVDGQKTLHLELTPKSDEVRAKVSKIQIWIEQRSWMPIQQTVFHTDAAQSVTVKYMNASRNVPVDDKTFKPKWPKGTKTVKR